VYERELDLGSVVNDALYEAIEWYASEISTRSQRELLLTADVKRLDVSIQLHPARIGGGFITLQPWGMKPASTFPYPVELTAYQAYRAAKRGYTSD
jgi:hypothetical protein